MISEDLIWYAAYGSNLSEERFLYYINGGTPVGTTRNYTPCDDLTPPRETRPYELNFELFFARHADSWNGGIAFIDNVQDNEINTLAKLYLISKTQFNHLAKQETQTPGVVNIDFEEAENEGRTVFKRPSWYGLVLFLGHVENIPVFTLTQERTIESFTKPSEKYLMTIASGLRQTHNLSNDEIFHYFSKLKGVGEYYKFFELYDVVNGRINHAAEYMRIMLDDYAKEYSRMPEGELKSQKKIDMENLMRQYYGEVKIDYLGESFN